MVSRRKFLASLSVAAAGLAGCQNSDEDPTRVTSERPPTESPTIAPTPDEQTPTATASPTGTARESTKSATPEPTPTIDEELTDRFSAMYDVTEQGADDTGTEPIDDVVQPLVKDDTLLQFPPGTYRLDDLAVEEVQNFGLVGADATFKVNKTGRAIFLGFRDVADIHFEGFSVDNTAPNTVGWCDLKCTGGDNVVRDYTVEGFGDVRSRTNGFTVMVEGEETSVTIENADLSQGAINAAATFVFPRREFYDPTREAGSLTFKNCVMKGWGKEGLYASPHEGPLKVIGGEYANNAIVQVRIGGGNAPQRAIVRDVTVRVDNVPKYMPERNRVLRGIWLKEGDKALVENCDITLADIGRNRTPGAVYVNDQFGRATIRDCTITTDNVSRPAILVKEPADSYSERWMPSLDHLPPEWDLTFENLTIDGKSPNTEVIDLRSRDDCTFRNVTIEKSGQGDDGLLMRNVNSCTVDGCSITTDRYPILIDFDGKDDCVLDLSDTSLTGNDVDEKVSEVEGGSDGEYCIGSDVLSDSPEPKAEQLALTSTEKRSKTTTETESEEYQLYGRWLVQ